MSPRILCPRCGTKTDRWTQPRVTVDAVVHDSQGRVLLIERGQPPPGWALPGGFVDEGESLEEAVARELLEETSLVADSVTQFHTYSAPGRDPRHHTVSTIYLVTARGDLQAGDDATRADFFPPDALPPEMAFDHAEIVAEIERVRRSGD